MLFRALLLAVLCLGGAQPVAAAPVPPPPLEAYGRLPAVEDLELSPKGDRVAFISVAGEDRLLVIRSLVSGESFRMNAGRAKVRDLAWAGDDHLLITTSTTAEIQQIRGRHEWHQVVSYNVRTRRSALLMQKTPDTLNSVQGAPLVVDYRGEPTVFVRGITLVGDGSWDLYRVDLDTGRGRIHARGGLHTVDWVVAPDGSPLARVEADSRRGEVRNLVKAGVGWRSLLETQPEEEAAYIIGRGRTPDTVIVSRREGDRRRWYEYPMAEGGRPQPIDDGSKPVDGLLYDPIGGQPLAVSRLEGLKAREYVFLQPELARAWDKVRRPFKNRQVSLQSWTRDFGKLVVVVEGEEDAGTYYLVDLKTNKADLLADAWPGVPPEAIAPVRTLTYKAADGLEIPAYLTIPAGRDARGLPLIVLPHGGPQARDEPGFDWWAQALASRGYAVLQPQFRGSDGFGRKFVEAGYGQWGRKMQTDLSDGVRHLASEGVIDPKRVCIMGASYGGYAALAGATLDPGVYRCAVSVNGVSDLPMMLAAEARDAGGSNRANVRYWSRFMGASFRQRGELDAVSPARQAAKAAGPVLLIHGKDDTVVPYQQSVEMRRALERAGKPVDLVTLPAEDHWLSRGATRLQMLKSAVAFVERHNPPQQ